MPPVLRFAPSPNGRLHLGHAYSALLNARLAARLQGRFLLRIEDIDTTRCKPEFTQACLQDLSWLGLKWEEPVRIQSSHWNDYTHALNALKEKNLIYPCFCSRKDIAETSHRKDPDGAPLYPGTCARRTSSEAMARIAAGEQHAWRLRMSEALTQAPAPYTYTRFLLPGMAQETVAADPARWGDVILARKETPTSYHLSVVVDDALQGITHVARGADLEAATDLHILLQRLLGLPTPLYHHHALITTETGDKLAKSKGSETLADLRARGVTRAQAIAMMGKLPL
jgi:glutamyl-Q tRNA(Asp) synthetase